VGPLILIIWHKDIWVNESIAPSFLTSELDENNQFHAPAVLSPGGSVRNTHLIRGFEGPQIRSGRCGEEKNSAFLGVKPRPSSPLFYRLS
jgi:hypothetical protein